MRSVPISLAALGLGVALSLAGGAASAHRYVYGPRYVTTYRPEVRYVRRTVVVRERVWRPVRHRIHHRRIYGPSYSRVIYEPAYGDYPAYRHHWWRERREWHDWDRERWEHRGYD